MAWSEGIDGEYGWKAKGNYLPPEARSMKPFFPRIWHAIKLLPMIIRLFIFCVKEYLSGRGAFIDMFHIMKHDPYTGVPLGGVGCGSIGTDFRGAFNRFSTVPGMKEQYIENIKANQFMLTVHDENGNFVYWSLLTCADFKTSHLKAWDTVLRPEDIRYRGLFPRAWREYNIRNLDILIVMEQLSPVIPHDYEDSSLPVGLFNFTVLNNSDKKYRIALTLTFQNGTGNKKWGSEGMCRSTLIKDKNYAGCSLKHSVRRMACTYAVSAAKTGNNVVTTSHFYPRSDGNSIKKSLEEHGHLTGETETLSQELAVAVSSSSQVAAQTSKEYLFSLVWDMPEIKFGGGERQYKRRYTRFFSGPTAAVEMTKRALTRFNIWKEAIVKWQEPILTDPGLPDWFKTALFNELYYVVDGSTSWVEFDATWLADEPLMSEYSQEWFKEYGRFAYMESWEYYMYNTYDVHFYASWALLQNWPALEMGIQYDFADQYFRQDDEQHVSMFTWKHMDRKIWGKTPHDLGHPMGEPWKKTNAYQLHDTAIWRDLNLKLVPLSWRDWKMIIKQTKSEEEAKKILEYLYKKSKCLVEQALIEWDNGKDPRWVIQNSGEADQTYDVWRMSGVSAYCGSLWLCTLTCVAAMAMELKDYKNYKKYKDILSKATYEYIRVLWNGRFFKFDEQRANEETVMSDQLCGIWFLAMIQEEVPLTEEHVKSSLQSIFEQNWAKFRGGRIGPVNGYIEDKKEDLSCIQSEEVWTGIAYALGSFFISQGMHEHGFTVTEGMYNSCWNKFGLQYQTPEAITATGYYRAIGYMRPLSIWAMRYAYKMFPKQDPAILIQEENEKAHLITSYCIED